MTARDRAAFAHGVISLGGPVAKKRALRGSGPGWVRDRSPQENVAFHEAGHVVASLALGRCVHEVSVIPTTKTAGHCVSSLNEDFDLSQPRPLIHDYRMTVGVASWMVPCDQDPQWRRILAVCRAMRRAAEEIIELNWWHVIAVAMELQKKKKLGRAEIESILRGRVVV